MRLIGGRRRVRSRPRSSRSPPTSRSSACCQVTTCRPPGALRLAGRHRHGASPRRPRRPRARRCHRPAGHDRRRARRGRRPRRRGPGQPPRLGRPGRPAGGRQRARHPDRRAARDAGNRGTGGPRPASARCASPAAGPPPATGPRSSSRPPRRRWPSSPTSARSGSSSRSATAWPATPASTPSTCPGCWPSSPPTCLAGPVAYLLLRAGGPSGGSPSPPRGACSPASPSSSAPTSQRHHHRPRHGARVVDGAERATTVVGTVSRTGGDGQALPRRVDGGRRRPQRVRLVPTPATSPVSTTAGRQRRRASARRRRVRHRPGAGPVTIRPAHGRGHLGRRHGRRHGHQHAPFGPRGRRVPRSAGGVDRAIDPGETVEFEFEGDEFRLGDPFQPPEAEVWPTESGFATGRSPTPS